MKQTAPFAVMIALLIVAGIVIVNWLNYKLKQRLLDNGPADDRLLQMIGKIWQPSREALKWGLLLLAAGIGLIIIYFMPDGDDYLPLNAGIEFVSVAAGFLAYYLILNKSNREN